jgi:hypothetical protein
MELVGSLALLQLRIYRSYGACWKVGFGYSYVAPTELVRGKLGFGYRYIAPMELVGR